jgi:hypothetical protein
VRDITVRGRGEPALQPCLFLLFPQGRRPSAPAVREALARSSVGQVSLDPGASEAIPVASDWLEVVVNGLAFDILGLSPGQALSAPAPRHHFGCEPAALLGCEAIGLAPGPHLAGATNAMPVVRTLLRLASALASQWHTALGASWLPADSAMERDLFVNAIEAWLAGGPFPALGLTGVAQRGDGRLASEGLAFFTGQELLLDAQLGADRVAATRLLLRLVDNLVEQPPLEGQRIVQLAGGGSLRMFGAGALVEVSSG